MFIKTIEKMNLINLEVQMKSQAAHYQFMNTEKDWIYSMKDLILVVIISLFSPECICSRTILVKQFILTPSAANNQNPVLALTQNHNPIS